MTILIVLGGFFPGKRFGGPPVSVDNFCSLLASEAECYIVTHNHDMDNQLPYDGIKEGWNDRGNAKVLYLSDKDYCASSFDTVIKEIQPDYIYLQSLFQTCVLPCLWLAKKNKTKVILATRGELCKGAFRKKYKKIPYILLLRLFGLLKGVDFQSTSDEETIAINRLLGAESNRIHLLTNIPSIPNSLPKRNKKQNGVGRFVFISRILWKKNLLNAISYFNGINGEVIFDIYGPKEDLEYWDDCVAAINKLPSNVRVSYKGILGHDDIHKTFGTYDAFLFPTLSENYGHVIAESLVTGCIPIISDQTPWTDINTANAGWAISLNDANKYREAIQEVVNMDEAVILEKRDNIARYIRTKLRMEDIKKEYLAVFK